MNKRIVFLLLAFLAFANMNAQILKPVKWTSKVEKTGDNEFNLVMEGKIDENWHVYSQFTPADGPLAAEFKFADAKGNYELIGKVKESPYKKRFNDVFEVDEYYFEGKVTFTQKVKITNAKLKTIKATIDYQVCKEVCINGDNKFTFTLPELTTVPAENTVATNNVDTAAVVTSAVDTVKTVTQEVKAVAEKETVPAPKREEKKGLLMIFFFAFLGGFAALMTPCVFPMIPMTVSFFTKQSKNPAQGKRNAIFYGISIILIYVILGLAITAIFGADALNALSTNPWFNIIFFFLLVFFAASFLGAFEIMLPNSWANKVDRQADRGGMIGILFMALALAIVSFSCTGPIVGTLLVESASKGGIAPIVGMLGFSSALALPFMLFAMFPGWLNSLPKSGGWLNTVKVSLGFLELALAFKFLSNADLVLQLHLLEREVFLVIWIAVFGTWAFYLFGKITTPHDSQVMYISVGRLTLGMLVLAFTLYMIPGLFGAPLKLISAFPPSKEYSESPEGFFGTGGNVISSNEALPEGAKKGPHGLTVFHDYEKGLAYAKKINKPVLLDFTGQACVNCRKMEANVWSDKKVLNILNNDVVLVSLYVDEKIDLPKNEQFVTKAGEEIVTVGDKWTDFMISRYQTNTQPLYALEGLDGKNLNPETPTTSYDPDAQKYANWLKKGIVNFKKS